MAEVLLIHHAQGLTTGCRAFADELRAAGNVVHTPDLYEGRIFATLAEGVEYGDGVGLDAMIQRGGLAAAGLTDQIVYAGFSLGAIVAQALGQTRPGAKGTLLFHGCAPTSWFESAWPDGVPLQIHSKDEDEWFERDVAQQLVAEAGAELFLYPGRQHLFVDSSLTDYDPEAASLLRERVLSFLAGIR